MDSPEDIAAHLIAGVLDRDGPLGKTKLVKLLYLIDVDQYSRYRARPTGFRWRYYLFGPYDAAVESMLRSIDLDIPQEDVETRAGTRAVVFRPRGIEAAVERARLSDRVARSVQRVLDRWALEDLYRLLDHVYFETRPMKDARPGAMLDFETIPRYQPPSPPRPLPPVEQKILSGLKDELKRATNERLRLRQSAARQEAELFRDYDRLYRETMQRFAAIEERPVDLEGSILVSRSWSDPEE